MHSIPVTFDGQGGVEWVEAGGEGAEIRKGRRWGMEIREVKEGEGEGRGM